MQNLTVADVAIERHAYKDFTLSKSIEDIEQSFCLRRGLLGIGAP